MTHVVWPVIALMSVCFALIALIVAAVILEASGH